MRFRRLLSMILIFLLVVQNLAVMNVNAETTSTTRSIQSTIEFDQEFYNRGDYVNVDVKLTGIEAGDKINSATFNLDFDGFAFDINSEQGVTSTIPFSSKKVIGFGEQKTLSVMLTQLSNIELIEGQTIFTAKFKVNEDAYFGVKHFNIQPTIMLDTEETIYTLSGDSSFATVRAAQEGIQTKLLFDEITTENSENLQVALNLSNIPEGTSTNSVTFELEYDSNAFSINPETDLTLGNIPFQVQRIQEYGHINVLQIMYTGLEDIALASEETIFYADFKMNRDAPSGLKYFTLRPVTMLDSKFNIHTINYGLPFSANTEVTSDQIPPEKPTVENVTDQLTVVTGTAEAGSTISVKVGAEEIGSAVTDVDGAFTVDIPVQTANTTLSITATDAAGNVSPATEVIVFDVTPPDAPVVNKVTDKDVTITGISEPDATIQVVVDNKVIGTTIVHVDGSFEVTIIAQEAGSELSISAIDEAENVSNATVVTVNDVTPPGAPTVDPIGDQTTEVTGLTEPGAIVRIKASGEELGSAYAGESGFFKVNIPVQAMGTELTITAEDIAGNTSEPTIVSVKDITPPSFTVDGVIDQVTQITGKTEAGAFITVLSNEAVLGNGTAGTDGSFVVDIPAQIAGTILSVKAEDELNNISDPYFLYVKHITEEKEINLLINPDAETGNTFGWINGEGLWKAQQLYDTVEPQEGDFFFWPGITGNALAIMSQDIDVSHLKSNIDTGEQYVHLSGWLNSSLQSPSDVPSLKVEAIDDVDEVLATYSTEHTGNGEWVQYKIDQFIPVGTTTLRVSLIGDRHSGSNNDSYFDNLQLVVNDQNNVSTTDIQLDAVQHRLFTGDTHQIVVTALQSDDSQKEVTSEATYTSSDTNVATVSEQGLVTAVSEGSAVITVSYENFVVEITADVSVKETSLTVQVSDEAGNPVPDARIMLAYGDDQSIEQLTDQSGQISITTPTLGDYKVFAYKTGYIANSRSFSVVENEANHFVLTLEKGELVVGTPKVERLTPEELIEKVPDIDLDDPDNRWVYEFEVHLAFKDVEIPSQPFYLNSGGHFVGTAPEPIYLGGTAKAYPVPVVYHPDVEPMIAYMIIPGEASWLKEFFEVGLTVQNMASSDFTLENSTVTIELPEGLTHIPSPEAGSLTLNMGDIIGGESREVNWILRGDLKGDYILNTSFNSTLQPFDEPINAIFTTPEPIKVWAEDAIVMHVEAQDYAVRGYPYHVRFGLENVSDVPVYDARVQLKEEGKLNYLYAPNQSLTQTVSELQPKTIKWFDYYVIPTISGELDLSKSFIVQTGGNATIDTRLTSQNRPENSPDVVSKFNHQHNNSDGTVVLEWKSEPSAEGYRIYSVREDEYMSTEEELVYDSMNPGENVLSQQIGTGMNQVILKEGLERKNYVITTILSGKEKMRHAIKWPDNHTNEPLKVDVTLINKMSIEDDVHYIVVADKYTAEPLANVEVTIDETHKAVTDSYGITQFKQITEGTFPTTMKKEGYYDYLAQNKVELGDVTIYFMSKDLDPDKPYISSVVLDNEIDLLRIEKSFEEVDDPEDEEIQSTITMVANWKDKTPESFLLLQDGIVVKEVEISDDKAIFENIVIGKDFQPDKKIYAVIKSNDGTYSRELLLNLSVYNDPLDFDIPKNGLNIDVGKKMSFQVPSDLPVLGGTKLDIGFNPVPVAFAFDEDKKKFKVGIGIQEFGENSFKESLDGAKKDFNNQFKEDMKKLGAKPGKLKFSSKVDFDQEVYGYIEGVVQEGQLIVTNGSILYNAQGKVNQARQFIVGPVPVYVEITAGANLKTIIPVLDFSPETGDITFDGQMTITPYFELGGGVGVAKVLTVGAYGKAELKTLLDYQNDYTKVDLIGSASIKAKALLFEATKEFARGTWTLYNSSQSNRTSTSSLDENQFNIYDSKAYQPMSRNYLEKSSNWLGNEKLTPRLNVNNDTNLKMQTENLVDSDSQTPGNKKLHTLQTNIFPNAKPKLVSLNGKKILVWIADYAARSSANRTMLVYSVEENDKWSEPVAVSDDGTADFYPQLASNGSDVYVVWQNSKQAFTSTVSLEDVAMAGEISVAKFDLTTNTFETEVTLTDNNTLDTQPQISLTSNQVLVTWTNNSNNDIFGVAGQNSIFYSTYSSEWQTPQLLVEELGPVTGIAVANFEGETKVAYIEDADSDLNTIDDRELFIASPDQMVQQVTDNTLLDSNPVFGTVNGTPALYWYKGSNIHYVTGLQETSESVFTSSKQGLRDDFKVINNANGNTAIMWTQIIENNVEIYAAYYNPTLGSWSEGIKISSQGTSVNFPEGTIDSSDNLTIALNKMTISSIGEEQTDLAILTVKPTYNIKVENVYYDADAVSENTELPIEITVSNTGEIDIQELEVQILDGSVVNNTMTLTELIKSGETKTVVSSINVPEQLTKKVYEVNVIVNDGLDVDKSDNTSNLTIGYADVLLALNKYIVDNQVMITAEISNLSHEATDVELEIREDTKNGPIFDFVTITNLKKGESRFLTFSVTPLNDFGNKVKSLYFTTKAAEDEIRSGNNYDYVVIEDIKEELILGDINNDKLITLEDVKQLNMKYGLNINSTGFDKVYDLNKDNYIDIMDLIVLMKRINN